MLATVNIITKEQVIRMRRVLGKVEEPQEVLVLAVDVRHNLDRCLQLEEHGLHGDEVLGLVNQRQNLIFWQVAALKSNVAHRDR